MTTIVPKERPILFSAPMIRALLAGTKTQTRREAKHPLARSATRILSYHGQSEFDCIQSDETGGIILCPYGQPGQRLWVRETLYFDKCGEEWCYVAGNDPVMADPYTAPILLTEGRKFVPSIHMPREASRLLLEITAVRCERLQDISEADAKAEGVKAFVPVPGDGPSMTAKQMYARLWESINGPGSWALNPWVWVVSFRLITPA